MTRQPTSRTAAGLFVACLLVLVTLSPVPAGAQDPEPATQSLGLRPANADPSNPLTSSFFIRSAAPGETLQDEVVVINSGDEPVDVSLFAATGSTAGGAGVAFGDLGDEPEGAAAWIALTETEFTLSPGEQRTIAFTVDVPSDATAGDHVAGLVVQPAEGATGPDDSLPGDTQFSIQVLNRIGVAVVVQVPGELQAASVIEGLRMISQDEESSTFEIAVRNTGNVLIKGDGELVIRDTLGEQLGEAPFQIGTVVPGNGTAVSFSVPLLLGDANYLLSGSFDYGSVLSEIPGAVTTVDEILLQVRVGQPEGSGGLAPPDSETSGGDSDAPSEPGARTISGTSDESATSDKGTVIVIVVGISIVLFGSLIFFGRRKRLRARTD